MPELTLTADLDDVTFSFNAAFLPYANRHFGTSYTIEDIKSYELANLWGVSVEEIRSLVYEFYHTEEHMRIRPVPGAVKALSLLAQYARIVELTSRPHMVEQITLDLIDMHFPKGVISDVMFLTHFHGPIENRGTKSKGEACKEIGAIAHIDDHTSHVHDIDAHGVVPLLFTQNWNRRDPIPADAIRVNGWAEACFHLFKLITLAKDQPRLP